MKVPATIALLLAGLFFAMAPTAAAASDWAVPGAKIRYSLKITETPEAPECGYFVHLPDGGLLGGKPPVTTAIAPDGRTLESRLMWHSVERGFYLVIQDPGAGAKTIDVYVSDTGKPNYWTPESALRPGSVLCTLPGTSSMATAKTLSNFSTLPRSMSVDLHKGIPRAVFSIGGDLLFRPPPWVFYMMGNVVAKSAGEFWIVPYTNHGSTTMLVNGREITPTNQMPGWGGTGAFVQLQEGLNRLEVYQTATEVKDWLFFFAWAPPYEQFRKPIQNARGAVGVDIVRSGSAQLTLVKSQDGSAVAAGVAQPDLLFWLEDEPPVVTYDLSALTEGNPPDTKYTWIFPGNATVEGPKVPWIFPANTDASVTLVAKSGKGVSRAEIPFFAHSFSPADLNLPTHNRLFREAILQMLRSYPAQADVLQQWSAGHWNNLFRTLEFNQSRELLELLFQKHGPALAKQLKPDQIIWLQKMLLSELETADPAGAAKWFEFFKINFKTPETTARLKIREAEMAIYATGDFEKAQAILSPMNTKDSAFAGKAQIRLGDIELLKGNLNGATTFYSQAQALAKARRTAPNAVSAKDESKPAAPVASPAPATTFAAKIQQRNEAREAVKTQREAAKGLAKAGAIQDVSFSENVATLLEGNHMIEASQVLEDWEEEFPLSKVSGDYIIRDAQWNAKAGNHKRAVAMLTAYCTQIDASSFLPKAVTQLIESSEQVPDSKAKTREVVESVLGRMKFHPVATQLEEYLKKP
ncbi:MAG: hypothetical protein ACKOLA_02015 [Spartobacteria bacterium]